MRSVKLIIYLLLIVSAGNLFAQQSRAEARAIIDTLRWGVDYKSAEALRRANQAKHLDSTYYIGHMMEAYHYSSKAEEHTGLAKAVGPFRKCIALYERDFGHILGRRYTRDQIFAGAWPNMVRQIDYYDFSNQLINSLISLEMPDSAYHAIRHFQKADLVFDFQSYHWLAWLYFRTRIYTSEKYPFLKDTIEENMALAFAFTDSLENRYNRNTRFLRTNILDILIQGSGMHNALYNLFIKGPKETIANTLGILHGYNFEPEKAARYFNMMQNDGSVAKMVNLGYTYHSAIDFRQAEHYFSNVPDRGSRTRGGHWQGYSTLFVYKGEPGNGAAILKENRDKHGFTIGYGWDNLCLARMLLYAGYIDECENSLGKADRFSEVHFNTSFREDQYRFMLKTLGLMQNQYEIKTQQFENKNHWFSWNWWKNMPDLYYTRYTSVYNLANELAENPERHMVYYHIFHTESIISFDELWLIIKNYSNNFFESTFERLEKEDPRLNLNRYYRYFKAMLKKEDGEDSQAFDMLTEVLNDPNLDAEYEKLLVARIHENCAAIADDNGWEPQKEFHLNALYQTYPEIVPYSDAQMVFKLQISDDLKNSDNPAIENILDRLYDFNIDWEAPEESKYPQVQLSIAENQVVYRVVLANREAFKSGAIDLAEADAGKALVYRLFNILR